MRAEIERQSAELAVLTAQLQLIRYQGKRTLQWERIHHLATPTPQIWLFHCRLTLRWPLIRYRAKCTLQWERIRHAHVVVMAVSLQAHAAVATDPLPSRAHVAKETDPPPPHVAVQEVATSPQPLLVRVQEYQWQPVCSRSTLLLRRCSVRGRPPIPAPKATGTPTRSRPGGGDDDAPAASCCCPADGGKGSPAASCSCPADGSEGSPAASHSCPEVPVATVNAPASSATGPRPPPVPASSATGPRPPPVPASSATSTRLPPVPASTATEDGDGSVASSRSCPVDGDGPTIGDITRLKCHFRQLGI
ncbi:uncharacterized protein LOC133506716 [Syngnathoides biaculeatus]|uniref:uncharacterized protein LOC133506716 n=1 Tax=Syngnathoides biaculeatus TaxID=300417 RepID=UPI002ADD4FE5|nr:uncharacterized protein LOC133506716 [Syngnathoides biaculeatus]XP_061687112.1 uncharacterized protein LOC133506716 [Syngnathoides biaculeatus]